MKLNPLRISLGISLVFHLLVVGAVMSGQFAYVPPRVEPTEPVMTLTLIAAPEKTIEALKPIAPPLAMPKAEPLKAVAAITPIEPEVPVAEKDEPLMTAVASSVPVIAAAEPTPPEKVSGDGGSLQSEPALTTTPSPPLVKAQPDYLKNPEPPYPPAALRRHQEGLVLLTVNVSAQGRVSRLEIKKSSGHPLLDAAAQKAVRDWQFEPARLGPRAVASEIEVPVRFELKESD
jgi:protein TonB